MSIMLRYAKSPSMVWWLSCLQLDLRFAGSDPAEDDTFSRAIKIRIAPSFGEEIKPPAQCRKVLRHVKNPCGVWKRYLIGKIHWLFLQSFSCFAIKYQLLIARELWWMNQEWLELRWGHTIDQSVMVAMLGTPCAIPPRNSILFVKYRHPTIKHCPILSFISKQKIVITSRTLHCNVNVGNYNL
jgi:hypothetical protein